MTEANNGKTILIETSVGILLRNNDKFVGAQRFESIEEAYELYKNQKMSESVSEFIKSQKCKIFTKFKPVYLNDMDHLIADKAVDTKVTDIEIAEALEMTTEEVLHMTQILAHKMSGVTKRPDVVELYKLVETFDKDINKRTMRIKEWYALHFPELTTDDCTEYLMCLLKIRNREEFVKNNTGEPELVNLAKNSMGRPFGAEEIEHIVFDTENILKDIQNRKDVYDLLNETVKNDYPNLYELMGQTNNDLLTLCRLFSISNSTLHKMTGPAIQVLGSKKDKSKYGAIFNTSYLARSKVDQGKISRMLGNKISLCAKIDEEKMENGKYGSSFREAINAKIDELNGLKQSKKKISVSEFTKKVYKKSPVEFVKK
ncbi:NOP56 [Enterospora canceri]|uniref:NOP56 n=1 Tax=Enterospora canceri TaxID=1081671 RepID=A0A1Y1S8K9_9MICR|nr:NOP56 [Enterospora canceri]